MSKKPVIAILALASAGVTAPVFAADNKFYGVLSIGRSKLDAEPAAVDGFNSRNGFGGSATSTSTGATGVKVQLGYYLNKTWALEGGYTYLGQANFTSQFATPTPGAIGGNKQASLFNLDVVAKIPFTPQFSGLARFGGYYWKTESNMPNAVTLGTARINDNGFDFKIGAGLQYDFTPTLGLRGEFERFNGVGKSETSGDSKVNMFTVGAVLKF